jgi:ATP-dependent RNA helicase MSS116
MFNACRRGPASISRVVRTASTIFTPVVRSSGITLLTRNVSRPAITSRYLTVSSGNRWGGAAHARQLRDEDDLKTTEHEGPTYTKFQELADQGLVHPAIIREITHGMGHETMTPVQTMTINESLKGRDT